MAEDNGVESTWSSMIMCRFRPRGCGYLVRYQIGQYDWARETVDVHQVACAWRYAADQHDPDR